MSRIHCLTAKGRSEVKLNLFARKFARNFEIAPALITKGVIMNNLVDFARTLLIPCMALIMIDYSVVLIGR